jgi:hypothetical protein
LESFKIGWLFFCSEIINAKFEEKSIK